MAVVQVPMGYRGIAQDLISRIEAGEYAPGTKLPSYQELQKIYEPVAISTLQRAILLLKERGYVVSVQGLGLYVSER